MRAFRSELIRIRRPAFLLGGIGLIALFAGIVSIFIFTSAENAPAAPQAGQGPGAYTLAEIASEGGFLTALPTVSRLAGVILLSLWAIAVATDYSTGLIRILAQAHPNRTRLLGGKIAALGVFTLLATTVTTLVVVVFARPLAKLEGIPIEAWKTDFASHLGKGFFDFTVAGLVWGLIGLMLAALTRSSGHRHRHRARLPAGRGGSDLHRRPGRQHLSTRRHAGHARLGRKRPTRLGRRARAGRPLRRRRRHCLPCCVPHPRHRLLAEPARSARSHRTIHIRRFERRKGHRALGSTRPPLHHAAARRLDRPTPEAVSKTRVSKAIGSCLEAARVRCPSVASFVNRSTTHVLHRLCRTVAGRRRSQLVRSVRKCLL